MFGPRKKAWSMMILVLYIMTISSLLIFFSIAALGSLIRRLDFTTDYLRSRSLSQWWIEYALSYVSATNHWFRDESVGFIDWLLSWLLEHRSSHLLFAKSFSPRLTNNPLRVEDCSLSNAFVLNPWDELIIPLFRDGRTFSQLSSDEDESLTSIVAQDRSLSLEPVTDGSSRLSTDYVLSVWFFPYDDELLPYVPPVSVFSGDMNPVDNTNILMAFLQQPLAPIVQENNITDLTLSSWFTFLDFLRSSSVGSFSQRFWYLYLSVPWCSDAQSCSVPSFRFCVRGESRNGEVTFWSSPLGLAISTVQWSMTTVSTYLRFRLPMPIIVF